MGKRKLTLIIISLILIIVPFFLNYYNLSKMLILFMGIIVLDITIFYNKKMKGFFLIYFPILLIIFTYAIDYIKTYTFNLTPIYIIENKVNDNVSIYNSVFYRIYKCNNEEIFDDNYKKSYPCDTMLIDDININKLLNEPENTYNTYKGDIIKVTGKISRLIGTNGLELQSYNDSTTTVNGYVKFNETSKLIVNINNIDITKYKIFDFISVVGILNEYDKEDNILYLDNSIIEDNHIYDSYSINVIESSTCNNELKEYMDGLYSICIDNIYLDYKVDKYELSYAIKDKKVSIDELIKDIPSEIYENNSLYKLEKFNILKCSSGRTIMINKDNNIDYSWCDNNM